MGGTHNTHKTQTSMAPARFEPGILANEWPPSLALDHSATGIGNQPDYMRKFCMLDKDSELTVEP